MTKLTETPQYRIRGVELYGFENMPSAVNFLMPPHSVRSGILVAINAEKILTAERDEGLRTLLAQAEYAYADGISIVPVSYTHLTLPTKRIV